MFYSNRSVTMILCLLVCCCLAATGCNKKRIYSDGNPPGTTVPAGAKVPAPSSSSASPAAAKTSPATADPVAQANEINDNEASDVTSEAAPLEPVQLGTELASEANLLTGTAGRLDDELIGFPMADGSSYDPDALVAGHRTLPLGSKVQITRVDTGTSVIVTIADRGPFDKSRVTDLSRAAAKALNWSAPVEVSMKVIGADRSGVSSARGTATPVSTAAQAQTAPVEATNEKTTPEGEPFYVQVGAFEDGANARTILDRLIQNGLTGSRLMGGAGTISRVQAGPYKDRAAAQKALDELRADYPASFIITPD